MRTAIWMIGALFPLTALAGGNDVWEMTVRPEIPRERENVVLVLSSTTPTVLERESVRVEIDGFSIRITGTSTFAGGPGGVRIVRNIDLGTLASGDYDVDIDITGGIGGALGLQRIFGFSVSPPAVRVPTLSGIGLGALALGVLFVAMRRFLGTL